MKVYYLLFEILFLVSNSIFERFLVVVWCKDVTGWSQTLYLGKDYLDFLILLPPPLDGWDCTGAWFNATHTGPGLSAC